MNKQGKVWGCTSRIFAADGAEVHRIVVDKGGYCSKHRHASKSNIFYVENGKLKVTVWQDGHVDETVLTAGDTCTVPPGVWHQFEALELTLAFECYSASLDPDDIERQAAGGTKGCP